MSLASDIFDKSRNEIDRIGIQLQMTKDLALINLYANEVFRFLECDIKLEAISSPRDKT